MITLTDMLTLEKTERLAIPNWPKEIQIVEHAIERSCDFSFEYKVTLNYTHRQTLMINPSGQSIEQMRKLCKQELHHLVFGKFLSRLHSLGLSIEMADRQKALTLVRELIRFVKDGEGEDFKVD